MIHSSKCHELLSCEYSYYGKELRSWTESYITQKHYGALFGETTALKSIVKFSMDPNAE